MRFLLTLFDFILSEMNSTLLSEIKSTLVFFLCGFLTLFMDDSIKVGSESLPKIVKFKTETLNAANFFLSCH